MEGDRRRALSLGDPPRVEVGTDLLIETDPELDGDGHAVGRGAPHGRADDRGQEPAADGQRRSPPLRVTLGAGQPKLRSTCSTPKSPMSRRVASPMVPGAVP